MNSEMDIRKILFIFNRMSKRKGNMDGIVIIFTRNYYFIPNFADKSGVVVAERYFQEYKMITDLRNNFPRKFMIYNFLSAVNEVKISCVYTLRFCLNPPDDI
jgi:hypothetical protein